MVGRGRPLEPRTTVIDIEGTERFQDILVWYCVQPCDEAVCKVGLRAQHQNNQLRQKKQIGWEYGASAGARQSCVRQRTNEIIPSPSISTSATMSCTSSSVGVWPAAQMRSQRHLSVMQVARCARAPAPARR
eukprot:COSAG02_NODE_1381_length_12972_cov_75.630700_2_plen_132_part_00